MADALGSWGIEVSECCDAWLLALEALEPQPGRFTELRECPTCNARMVVVFKYVATDEGQLVGCALAAESIS